LSASQALCFGIPLGRRRRFQRQCFGFSVRDSVRVEPGRCFGGEEGTVIGFTDSAVRVLIDWRGTAHDFSPLDLQKV